MDIDDGVGIDCGSGGGRVEEGKGENWDNCSKIKKNFKK